MWLKRIAKSGLLVVTLLLWAEGLLWGLPQMVSEQPPWWAPISQFLTEFDRWFVDTGFHVLPFSIALAILFGTIINWHFITSLLKRYGILQSLEISYEDNMNFRRGDISPIEKTICHTLVVQLLNTSNRSLQDCSVRFEDITGPRGERPFQKFPVSLQNTSGSDTFRLRPYAPEFAYVVTREQDIEDGPIMLRLRSSDNKNVWHGLGRGPYMLTIGLFSEGPSCTKQFRVFVDDRNVLMMEPQ